MRIFRDLSELPRFKNAVLTIGSFDGVHTGHQKIIERVKQIAKTIEGESVLITFHPHPRLVLSPNTTNLRLLCTIEEKIKLLEKYGIDNLVIVPFTPEFHQQSPEDYIQSFLVEKFHPHTIVIGYDHRFGKNRAGDITLLEKFARKNSYQIVEIQKQEVDDIAVSSTKVRKALESGKVEQAAALMQHPYTLTGKVVEGQKIGKSLGFPTANLEPEEKHKLVPAKGIYAVWVTHGDRRLGGMLYIGNRPTLKNHHNQTIEVNLFDFSEDLYGKNIEIEFVAHLREDQSFPDLDGLRQQLGADELAAREILGLQKKKPADRKAKVAVVILNYNTSQHLQTFLPSVLQTQYPDCQIIVADNGSTDDSLLVLKKQFPEVAIIPMPQNLGFAGGYNAALKEVDNEYVVLLNSDVAVEANWLEPLLAQMERDPGIGAIVPKILAYQQPENFEYAGAAGGWMDVLGYPFCRGRIFDTIEKDSGQYDQPREIFWASGCAMLVRNDLYQKLEGLDADFFAHMEEIDFCWRLKSAGYKIMVEPKSVVYHLGGGTLNYQSAQKTYLNFRNSLYTLYKNEESGKVWGKVVLRLLLDGVAGLQFLAKGAFKNLLAIVRAHWVFFGNIFYLNKKRKKAQELIESIRIGESRAKEGRFSGSIVWYYFVRGKKHFSEFMD